MYAGTALLSLHAHEHYSYFLSYTNLPCTLSAAAVFLFVKYHDWQRLLTRLYIKQESLARHSSLSLGVYLIQALGFKTLDYFDMLKSAVLVRFAIMYILCIITVWLMKKIPIAKRLVP